jgi:competence protein ComEA
MLKKILAIAVMLYAAVCFAAVDANKATAAELDGIKGIGPSISSKILDERKKGNFKDWTDFISRVKGLGEANAAKFSAEGLTVNGAAFKAAAAAAPAAPAAKTAAPAPVASAAKPAASAPKK